MNLWSIQKDIKKHDKLKLNILWSFYNILGWEGVTFKDIQQYLINFPQFQNQVQQIVIENGCVKFNKLGKSLKFNPETEQFRLEQKLNQFNRFEGRQYLKSLTKITNQNFSYQFKGKIRRICSNQQIIAVRTDKQISIINSKWIKKSFNIETKQIQVCGNRCYYVNKKGFIGSIIMQTTFLPNLGQVGLEEIIYSDNLKQNEFLASGQNQLLILSINLDQEIIQIRKLQGKIHKFQLNNIDLSSPDEALVSRKAFIQKGYLHLFLFLGVQKDITQIIHYKFLIF